MNWQQYLNETHPNPQFRAIQYKAARAFAHPHRLPSLTRQGKRWTNRRLTLADTRRAMRSDHLINCHAVIHVALKFVSKHDRTVQVSVERFAAKTGLARRTIDRCLKSLDEAGIMATVRRPIKLKGKFTVRMFAAVRKISRSFFIAIRAERTYDGLASIPATKHLIATVAMTVEGEARRQHRRQAWMPQSVKTWRSLYRRKR